MIFGEINFGGKKLYICFQINSVIKKIESVKRSFLNEFKSVLPCLAVNAGQLSHREKET